MKAGAKGIKTLVSGRLGGAEIARNEGYSEGVVPLHTLRSDIDFGLAEAHTTYGRLGVKVWICRGEILPERKAKSQSAQKESNARCYSQRVKYRRPRLSYEGKSKAGNEVVFGEFGLQACEGAYVTNRQIEAARITLSRYTKKRQIGLKSTHIYQKLRNH